VDSELSGNVIDLCPVGALTSKPFRFAARTWELSRRKSVSPHDGLGANLIVQVKHDKVLRVLPLENEAVNECWLSDKDRFSYEALNSDARLTRPMLKQCGEWREVDWQTALEFIGTDLKRVVREHGCRIARRAGLAARHGSACPSPTSRCWIASWSSAASCARTTRCWPSACARRRRNSPASACCTSPDDDQLIALQAKSIVAPSALATELAGIVKAVAEAKGAAVDAALAGVQPSAAAKRIAESLASGEEGRHLPRQLRPTACPGGDPACAGAATGRADRRALRHSRRGGQFGRRLPRQGRAGRGRPERRRDDRAAAQAYVTPEP
jgi:NADH-quinone oxidoreductase subunit G